MAEHPSREAAPAAGPAGAPAGHPYAALPAAAYWRSGVAERRAEPGPDWVRPKWPVTRAMRIATAGSCFAQHLGRRLRREGFDVIDAEPAPALLPPALHEAHGYGIYSGRYGNLYTARQFRQLAEEAFGRRAMATIVWEREGRFVDALRPTIEPEGHGTAAAVLAHRRHHLDRVGDLLRAADLVVFTLGLTESWEDAETGTVFPVCPGTVAGRFDPARHRFRNLTVAETAGDLRALRALLHEVRPGRPPRFLLTVSPVPLTATASGAHVMLATVHSKAVLRAAAGELAAECDDVDYFPSYEIVTNPWSAGTGYGANLRSVTEASVETVMRTFLAVHAPGPAAAAPAAAATPAPAAGAVAAAPSDDAEAMAVKCDEELLDAFGPRPA
ncbi:MAG: GSCFA domain-containing protein [Rhodobacteraceae bacterium]|nr:GSCFA domain-containing protein [Paracoccaceae bacterium]